MITTSPKATKTMYKLVGAFPGAEFIQQKKEKDLRWGGLLEGAIAGGEYLFRNESESTGCDRRWFSQTSAPEITGPSPPILVAPAHRPPTGISATQSTPLASLLAKQLSATHLPI